MKRGVLEYIKLVNFYLFENIFEKFPQLMYRQREKLLLGMLMRSIKNDPKVVVDGTIIQEGADVCQPMFIQ